MDNTTENTSSHYTVGLKTLRERDADQFEETKQQETTNPDTVWALTCYRIGQVRGKFKPRSYKKEDFIQVILHIWFLQPESWQ